MPLTQKYQPTDNILFLIPVVDCDNTNLRKHEIDIHTCKLNDVQQGSDGAIIKGSSYPRKVVVGQEVGQLGSIAISGSLRRGVLRDNTILKRWRLRNYQRDIIDYLPDKSFSIP
jgi:hypothetical protein